MYFENTSVFEKMRDKAQILECYIQVKSLTLVVFSLSVFRNKSDVLNKNNLKIYLSWMKIMIN